MQDEINYMSYALKLANRGRFTTHPNPNVGCIIVKNNVIVGKGYHYRAGKEHAEIYALRMAGKKAKNATAYITLEPCNYYGRTPPCCEALINSGIKKVIVAMEDPNPKNSGKSLNLLKKSGIEVKCGLMEDKAEKINKGFLKRMRTGFPYVQLKLGASLDGRTAMANGESKWITSKESRRDIQYIRAKSHAILTSHATILSDNPELTVRWNELSKEIRSDYPEKELRQPLRIIIDGHNRIVPTKQKITRQNSEIWFARIKEDFRYTWSKNFRSIIVPERDGHLDLRMLMLLLGKKEINSVLIEAGARLSGAFIQNKLIDELIIYLAPKLLGSDARDLCILQNINNLSDALEFKFDTIRSIGPDVCLQLIRI